MLILQFGVAQVWEWAVAALVECNSPDISILHLWVKVEEARVSTVHLQVRHRD